MKRKMSSFEKKELAWMIVRLALIITGIALLIWVSPYFAFVILALVLWMGLDLILGLLKKSRPVLPAKDQRRHRHKYHFNDILWLLENPDLVNPEISFTLADVKEDDLYAVLEPGCHYIRSRYDCMDFRATSLYRFYKAGGAFIDKVSPSGKVRNMLEETMLGMKFWISEKGHDSVCYFSENHEITFFVLEYLIGRLFPDRVFKNDKKTGAEKEKEGRERMITWFELRGKYGFSEFYSHNYLPIDFANISLLVLHGDRTDKELMDRAKGILDILCLDYAHSYAFGTIIGAQGRAYARNNINCAFQENTTDLITDAIWNNSEKYGGLYYHKPSQVGAFLRLLKLKDEDGNPIYQVPEAIKAIGRDTDTQVIRSSFGLDLKDIRSEGLYGLEERQIMFQLGMVALSNPEVINNTFDYVNEHSLIYNEFLSPFKYFNISILRFLGVFPFLSRWLNIYPNGVALERSNVYIYKTKDYKLSTLINYKPGSAGAQQTTMAALLPGGVTVFTHHPLKDQEFRTAPGFWGGYGTAPHAVQHENVTMLIHRIPRKITFSPERILPYTHTYLPEELLDEVRVQGRYAFAKKGNTFLALIGASDFEYLPFQKEKVAVMEGLLKNPYKSFELVQRGRVQYTIYELSSADKESYEDFMQRIKSNAVSFDGKNLAYHTGERALALHYGGDFTLNGETQECKFKRYDSQYVQTDYLGEEITVKAGGFTHKIHIRENVRESSVDASTHQSSDNGGENE